MPVHLWLSTPVRTGTHKHRLLPRTVRVSLFQKQAGASADQRASDGCSPGVKEQPREIRGSEKVGSQGHWVQQATVTPTGPASKSPISWEEGCSLHLGLSNLICKMGAHGGGFEARDSGLSHSAASSGMQDACLRATQDQPQVDTDSNRTRQDPVWGSRILVKCWALSRRGHEPCRIAPTPSTGDLGHR